MADRPDPAQSRAVLIGVGAYDSDHLPDISKMGVNLRSMQDLLTDRDVWGLPGNHVIVSQDPEIPFNHVRQPIKKAGREARDTLLVYFAGHGLVLDRRLHLAIKSTDPEFPADSAVRWADVKEVLAGARARTKIVILDCCFAERAKIDGVVATLSEDAADKAPQDAVTYLFCATSMTQAAVNGDGPRTLFTDEVYKVLKHGIPNGPEHLTLRSVHEEVHSRLARAEQPTPRFYSHPDPSADTVLFKANPQWTPTGIAAPDAEAGLIASDVIGRLTEEQRALIDARPGYRPARRSGPETPQLVITLDSADEAGGRFDVPGHRRGRPLDRGDAAGRADRTRPGSRTGGGGRGRRAGPGGRGERRPRAPGHAASGPARRGARAPPAQGSRGIGVDAAQDRQRLSAPGRGHPARRRGGHPAHRRHRGREGGPRTARRRAARPAGRGGGVRQDDDRPQHGLDPRRQPQRRTDLAGPDRPRRRRGLGRAHAAGAPGAHPLPAGGGQPPSGRPTARAGTRCSTCSPGSRTSWGCGSRRWSPGGRGSRSGSTTRNTAWSASTRAASR